jgi:alkanesulfonate monooxygenase SsuD/methylene tetrahydromethanopterin reductase-like flavin-dependent oxidoreductase (luciferase family)
VDAGLPGDVAADLAARAEGAGYTSIWTTDAAAAAGLLDLAAYARGSERIRIGVGVLPLDRHTPDSIAEQVRSLALPLDRLWLGLGSGGGPHPLRTVREAVPVLREALPGVVIVVAAMGPQMTRLASAVADAVQPNWLTPPAIEAAKRLFVPDSAARTFMYVRAALDPGGRERVAREAGRYAANRPDLFAANGVPLDEVGVAGAAGSFDAQLAPYEALLDETIVRALPASRDPEDLFALLEAARPSR